MKYMYMMNMTSKAKAKELYHSSIVEQSHALGIGTGKVDIEFAMSESTDQSLLAGTQEMYCFSDTGDRGLD